MTDRTSEITKPPLTNKGGNDPQKIVLNQAQGVSVNLDWLRWTVAYRADLTEADNLRLAIPRFAEFQLSGEELSNARGFTNAQKLTIGVIHWHKTRPEQGISVELSGRDLGASREALIADEALLGHIASVAGRVSTMDSAIDVYNHQGQPLDIQAAQSRGKLRTTVKSIGVFQSAQKRGGQWYPANTVYIGSPTSERQIRVYDKAAQQKIDGDWVRLEMRWRGDYARAAHNAMLKFGIEETTRAAVLSMVDFDSRWWRAALRGKLAKIEPIHRPDTKTIDWLLGAVYRTLDRELDREYDQGGSLLLAKFGMLIDQHRAKRKR